MAPNSGVRDDRIVEGGYWAVRSADSAPGELTRHASGKTIWAGLISAASGDAAEAAFELRGTAFGADFTLLAGVERM